MMQKLYSLPYPTRLALMSSIALGAVTCGLACLFFIDSGDLSALACAVAAASCTGLATYVVANLKPAAEPEVTPAAKQDKVSEMREALAREQEENRLKGEFLAHVSHELRTPLNAIINVPAALCQDYETFNAWHCEGCGNDYSPSEEGEIREGATEKCPECGGTMTMQIRAVYHGDPSEHYRFLRKTQHAAQHLLAVVSDILDFSKLDAGKMTITLSRTAVRTLIDEVRDTAGGLASPKGIILSWPEPPSAWAVDADPLKAAQILLNLLSNAVKFSPQGGRITVLCEVDASPNMMRFSVRDEGGGIPADKVQKLFENYRQVDDSAKRAHGGTGLGLVISRKLVELHGGKIGVDSVVGQGSTFHFTLPSSSAPAREFAGQVQPETDPSTLPGASVGQVMKQQLKRER